MNINGIIVHKIDKDSQNPEVVISERDTELSHSSPVVIELVEYIWNTYKKGKTFGSFNPDKDNNPVQTWISDYLEDPDNNSFVDLTLKIMNRLKLMLKDENFATGGHILFMHFVETEKPWFMVAMIKDKKGFIFTDDLNLEDITELELDKLHQVVRIDIDSWQTDAEKAYLSFIKSGSGDIANYYLKTFGCTDAIRSKQSTQSVIAVIDHVCTEAGLNYTQTREIKNSICHYMEQKLDGVSLVEIETQFQSKIDQEYWGQFIELANSEDYQVSESFDPSKQVLSAFKRIKLDTPHWKFSVDKDALGAPDSDADVIYNKEDHSLIIKDVPKSQRAQFLKIIDND